ncbi:MAG: deoxyribose-phosphate aldolase, partial [Propionibacteriales bacterium]|nr:deoxyribose-phosphate aldolase [Propionibacteriales bacterium]
MSITPAELAHYVDHTLLSPTATDADVAALAAEAVALGTYSICVSPAMLPVTAPLGGVKVATVCGFPSGKHTATMKAAEAAESVTRGADEVDMVIDLGLVKAGRLADTQAEIAAVRASVPEGKVLKVIIESAALTDDEIVACCQAAEAAGA